MKAPDLWCHFTLNSTTALYNIFLPWGASETLSLMLIDSHWLSLHRSHKQSCWATAHLTSSSSILPLVILLAGWVTSWQSCWPCVRKFTARCNHLLCSKRSMLELFHLRELTALYCKCAISIHEGIYMHSQVTLPVFIIDTLHTAKVMAFSQVMMALLKGTIQRITLKQS